MACDRRAVRGAVPATYFRSLRSACRAPERHRRARPVPTRRGSLHRDAGAGKGECLRLDHLSLTRPRILGGMQTTGWRLYGKEAQMPIDLTEFSDATNIALEESSYCVVAICGPDGRTSATKAARRCSTGTTSPTGRGREVSTLPICDRTPASRSCTSTGSAGNTCECTAGPSCMKKGRCATRSWQGPSAS